MNQHNLNNIKSALALGRRAQCLSKEVKMGFWLGLLGGGGAFVTIGDCYRLIFIQLLRGTRGQIVALLVNRRRAVFAHLLLQIPPDFGSLVFPEFSCHFVTLKVLIE